MEAQIRSGLAFGMHGLTRQEEWDRQARSTARKNYYQTVDLYNQYKASKGKGKGKGKPKSWGEMSRSEKWWLEELWEGRLRKQMDEAEGKCHRIQAPRFFLDERDE